VRAKTPPFRRIFFCCLALVDILLGRARVSTTAPSSLTRFESQIKAFEAKDRATPPPRNGTVFVGSSSFTLWKSLEDEFSDFKAINRGFGGSTIPEVTHYSDRIVIPYHPRRIVMYCGSNDIADGHSPQQVCADFRAFVAHVRNAFPGVPIYFISMSLPPSRVRFEAQYKSGNRCIQQFIAGQRNLVYIDVTKATLDDAGHLRRELFRVDALHMTPAGYALWIPIIRHALSTGP